MREMKGHTLHSAIEWATVEAVVDVCVVYAVIVNPIKYTRMTDAVGCIAVWLDWALI